MAILLDPKSSSEKKPNTVPLVTLREGVIFPNTEAILSFGRTGSIHSVNKAEDTDKLICIASQKSPTTETPQPKDIYKVATLCRLEKTIPVNGEIHAIVRGLSRVHLDKITVSGTNLMVVVSEIPELYQETDEIRALANHLTSQVKKAVNLGKSSIDVPVFMRIVNTVHPPAIADQVASVLDITNSQRQALLEENDLFKRLQEIAKYLDQEINVLELERKIANKTQKKFDKSMKEAVLRERMRTIQKELGDDSEDQEIVELRKKLFTAKLPTEAHKKAVKELDRLAKLSIHNPEASYIRTWLETIVEIPWSTSTKQEVSLKKASAVLNADHYGLEEAKERILEYLAVMKLRKARKVKATKNGHRSTSVVPTIICFAGPPGVGKTSVGRSIAKALGRKFAKISLGGIRDEAEIRGHRRTYVGAMPGRVVQAIIDSGSNNPVLMLDEIDKIGADYRGDPSSALLEVLDPEQNYAFVDHYLDTPIDLSKIIFITTANVLETIPPALRDRLEIIRFSGYTEDEKFNIAKTHLLKKQLESNALGKEDVDFTDEGLKETVKHYTRESGVRSLEREVAKVFRKAARKIASSKSVKTPISITSKNVNKYLGPRKFTHTLAEDKNTIGISTGLAYTEVGGDILFIEVALMEGKGRIQITGQLGDVMKESAQAALSYVRANAKKLKINPKRFATTDIHIHVPEGATPKDGPSAGAAITTAIVSAFTNKPTDRLIGMTGEITLRGRVTEIGGLKEKTIAAHRAGLKEVIVPKDNQKDLVKIPKAVKQDLKFHFVSHMDQVLPIVLQ